MSQEKQIVTRFAPSPTGFLHVGGVRTALYAWAFARKHGGRFILRIEDTDKAREVEGSITHIIESLTWLGIDWDEGVDIGGPHAPYLQSKRLESYKKYANILIEKGYAYPDPYSEEEIAELRLKAEQEKRVFLFRDHRPETIGTWDGTKPLRFKIKEIKESRWHDAVRGELHAGPEALDDFILIKSDGYPTYNFAHIIDDLEMGVTHIMRADEFIASVPKFLALYEALSITPPILVTLPPILGAEGTKKLSKRDGAKDILDYRNEGYVPEALVNFLAFLGWNPGGDKEIMTPREIIEAFSIEKIHKSGAMFNEEKLLWMNKEHIRKQGDEVQLSQIKKFMPQYGDELLKKLRPLIVDRISFYGELLSVEQEEFRLFLERPVPVPEKLIWKDTSKEKTIEYLTNVLTRIQEGSSGTPDEVKSCIMPYADTEGRGNVLWPLRVSLSGKEKSIDPFSLIAYLGKEESLARINSAIGALKA
ncbi:MAG: glutamyl-tRNA synthetase [Patescibacteria group bacterium]|nr:glutamyl-tRNA synthetase [Patescibacteria group bacterium]